MRFDKPSNNLAPGENSENGLERVSVQQSINELNIIKQHIMMHPFDNADLNFIDTLINAVQQGEKTPEQAILEGKNFYNNLSSHYR